MAPYLSPPIAQRMTGRLARDDSFFTLLLLSSLTHTAVCILSLIAHPSTVVTHDSLDVRRRLCWFVCVRVHRPRCLSEGCFIQQRMFFVHPTHFSSRFFSLLPQHARTYTPECTIPTVDFLNVNVHVLTFVLVRVGTACICHGILLSCWCFVFYISRSTFY